MIFSFPFFIHARLLENLLVEGLANVGKPEPASGSPLGRSRLLALGLLRLGAKHGVHALDTATPALMVSVSCVQDSNSHDEPASFV